MLLDKWTGGDSGSVDQGPVPGSPEETDLKYRVLEQSVRDGDFTLEEGLKVYKINRQEYFNHQMQQLVEMFRSTSVSTQDVRVSISVILSGLEMMYTITPHFKDPNLEKIIDLSHAFSKKMAQ